jgi:translocator protein
MHIPKNVVLVACIIGCIGLGSLPSLCSINALQFWFPTLKKPSWNPPAYLFGPVWTLLFTLMGIAFWQIVYSNHIRKIKAIQLFSVQFILNMCWTIIFFTMQSPGCALIEIIFLLATIIGTFLQFYKIKKTAGLLLIPYILWVSFATILNATIYWLNK